MLYDNLFWQLNLQQKLWFSATQTSSLFYFIAPSGFDLLIFYFKKIYSNKSEVYLRISFSTENWAFPVSTHSSFSVYRTILMILDTWLQYLNNSKLWFIPERIIILSATGLKLRGRPKRYRCTVLEYSG